MKRLLNVLGALVSDLTQNELAARGACRCHKFRSGGFGMDVFLTTEDAKAVAAFRKAAPENWNVVVYDAAVSSDKVLYGRHGMADQARNHRESGYHSLVALVLAMQADAFVITSGSNWSRLMEELCLGRDLEPRCDIVDVTPWRPHDW